MLKRPVREFAINNVLLLELLPGLQRGSASEPGDGLLSARPVVGEAVLEVLGHVSHVFPSFGELLWDEDLSDTEILLPAP